MFVIGLVGGIASGKSAVASQLASLGAEVIDADRLGHEVLDDPEVIAAAIDRWGNEILDQAGRLDRRAIAAHVFPTGDEQVDHPPNLSFGRAVRIPGSSASCNGARIAVKAEISSAGRRA